MTRAMEIFRQFARKGAYEDLHSLRYHESSIGSFDQSLAQYSERLERLK